MTFSSVLIFLSAYIESPEVRGLPKRYLDEIVRVSKIREEWDLERDVVFG
jgi:hypothetical protein